MRNSFKLAALAGALSMAIGSSATAAPGDLSFDGWTVGGTATGGTVHFNTATVCLAGSGYSCSEIASGDGFAQVKVESTDSGGDGDSYVMTIVTDQNAGAGDTAKASTELGFSDVSFIRMKITLGVDAQQNDENVGMMGRQLINEFADGTQFDSETLINTGWAEVGATNPLQISQRLVNDGETSTVGDDFETGFLYKSTNNAVGIRNGYMMDIDQIAGLATAGDSKSTDDSQAFALRQRQGTFVNSDGSVSMGTGDNAKSMTWTGDATSGDDIKAIWTGQKITSMASHFGYLSYDNKNDVADPIADFNLTESVASGAWGTWDVDAFGAKPCAGNPQGIAVLDADGEVRLGGCP